jgi:hypothetical protein
MGEKTDKISGRNRPPSIRRLVIRDSPTSAPLGDSRTRPW